MFNQFHKLPQLQFRLQPQLHKLRQLQFQPLPPAPKVPSAVPTPNSAPKEEEKELPKTAGHSSGMAQVLGVLGLIAGFSLVGKAKRDE